jgi:hypothetical protein
VTYQRPTGATGDGPHLERLVQALSAQEGVATERMRRWVSTMALLSALERVGGYQDRFLLKGGVALELRFKLRARATRDVDLIVTPHGDADLVLRLRMCSPSGTSSLAISVGDPVCAAAKRGRRSSSSARWLFRFASRSSRVPACASGAC